MKASIMIARFPYRYAEHPACVDWLIETILSAKNDPRISEVHNWWIADTPITMTRNRAIEEAKRRGVDLLLMVDDDMGPDYSAPGIPSHRKFWPAAFNFWWEHKQPCLIAAPYVGPHENVYVFRWRNWQSNHKQEGDFSLEQFSREEAAERGGIEEVAALATGLIVVDMRLFSGFRGRAGLNVKLNPPYFRYEYKGEFKDEKVSTEDVVFTRNASLLGCPCYVTWDCWALHYKTMAFGAPRIIGADAVAKEYRDAIIRGHHSRERLIMVDEGPDHRVA